MSTSIATAPIGAASKALVNDTKPSAREVELQNELKAARDQIGKLSWSESKVRLLETQLLNHNKRKVEDSSVPASSKKVKISPVTPASLPSTKLVAARLQQTIKNSLKGIKFFNGYDVTDGQINVNDVLSMQEFQAVFDDYGTLFSRSLPTSPSRQSTSKN